MKERNEINNKLEEIVIILNGLIVQVLTDSVDVKQYIKKLKSRDRESNNNWGTICTLVELFEYKFNKMEE